MRVHKLLLFLLSLGIAVLLVPAPGVCEATDGGGSVTVLRGGTVFSGKDEDPVVTDVWLQGDRIISVGGLDRPAERVIDVTGLAVAPGFIDLHSHAVRSSPDRSGLYRWPDAENLVRQGVTTVIGGPDGWSPLPLEDSFEAFEQRGAAVNFGSFVGHGAVRARIIGLDDRAATPREIERMRAEVDLAMRQGAFGLSSGLVYVPGSFSDTAELVALAEVAGQHGGIYISHMRNEALTVLDSVRELIAIAQTAGLPGQITHAKAMGTSMQGRSKDLLALVDAAVERGVDITLDQYPYAAGSTGLTAQFPRWSLDGGTKKLAERLEDPALRSRIHQTLVYELTEVRGRNDPANVQLAYCDFDHSLDGLNLAELLERKGREITIDNAATLIIELQEAGGDLPCHAPRGCRHDSAASAHDDRCRRRYRGAGERPSPSPQLRHLCTGARPLCAGVAGTLAAGGYSQNDAHACRADRSCGTRPHRGRCDRRYCGLRPRYRDRSSDVRAAAPVCGGRAARVRGR
ncbi:MAG: amidohydrolase family protein [Woeseiaceae bacterium]